MKNLASETQGYIYAILAFTFWGLIPIYFKIVSSVSPLETLSHRIIWSAVLLFGMILFSKSLSTCRILIQDFNKLKFLLLSALLVATNWLVFIWAVNHNMIVEASLGYYINPLVNFALGALFFKEKPNVWQKVAMALALFAIVYQVISLGTLPMVSLTLAFSFAFYGLIRKKINLPSVVGLYVETLILFPMALGYFVYICATQQNSFIFPPNALSWWLVLAGVITVVPLLWFNAAATRISLMHIGFFQYIGPTVSFLLAIFIYDEIPTKEKLVTFCLIWIALFIFSFNAYTQKRKKVY
ncbi:MAG: EamA family transporter RarD [Sulfurospirillaceae bacterium]|nr:EamA family transporter RarD [Sulfurospirillaceae bacterium]MDD3462732.1 EamA family transporter RarD [Sulfurospirillaceae bacterium]